LATIAITRLKHNGVGDLTRQRDLEGKLVHAVVVFTTREVCERVLNIDEGLCKARRVAELGALREVTAAETNKI